MIDTTEIDGNVYFGFMNKWVLISGPLHEKLMRLSAGSYAAICVPYQFTEYKWERINFIEHHNIFTGYICNGGILPPPESCL